MKEEVRKKKKKRQKQKKEHAPTVAALRMRMIAVTPRATFRMRCFPVE